MLLCDPQARKGVNVPDCEIDCAALTTKAWMFVGWHRVKVFMEDYLTYVIRNSDIYITSVYCLMLVDFSSIERMPMGACVCVL